MDHHSGTQVVQPKGHKPQTQPLTVALKNICRDYPAGGGVLRELLQNADDAGASTVRFVLDSRTHPTGTVVHEGVKGFQGPALLAYNDSTFSEQDFESLSRIGDSCKQQDGSTTGKFGRGFNAVYNWTDSPSIVSRDTLLILDPHERWSKAFKPPGGPYYDFVAQEEVGDMRDQMTAFSAILKELDRPFQGTIIRIPLRTVEQVKDSDICDRATSFSDVANVMQNFVTDFGYTGLLFMKNVAKISVEIGDQEPIVMCMKNSREVREQKTRINGAIKKVLSDGMSNFTTSFEAVIESSSPSISRQFRFAVHHSIQNYPENESLREWSKREAMVPWVAVASEIRADDKEIPDGALFNVLPTPIRINQPICIHGCFSMSPDRAQLHKLGDSGVQYPLPGMWNRWLFEGLIPIAWANLLDFLAKHNPDQSAFNVWPNAQEDINNALHHIDRKVLQILEKGNYRVWYTDVGYVSLGSGLVSNVIEKSSRERKAFIEAGVPAIYLSNDLKARVKDTCRIKCLTPQTVCNFLKQDQTKLRQVNEEVKQVLLDYIISETDFRGYGAVELFPFEDGTYKAIDNVAAFVHQNDEERDLFKFDPGNNIALQKLSPQTRSALIYGCYNLTVHSSLRYRSTSDLKKYCLSTYFKNFRPTEDRISVDDDIINFISKVWSWIVARKCSILDKNVSNLWLLQLSNGEYRKIKPSNASSATIYAAPGEQGDFLKYLADIKNIANKPIIRPSNLPATSVPLLKDAMMKDSALFIKNSDILEDFMFWLNEIRQVVNTVATKEILHLHKLLVSQIPYCKDCKNISKILHRLKIFKSVLWKPVNDQMILHETWVTLEELPFGDKIGLRQLDAIPNIGSVTFLDAHCDDITTVLSHFRLARCPHELEIVKEYMIPFWKDDRLLETWTRSGKELICNSLLRSYYILDSKSRSHISSLPIIPVQCLNGDRQDKFLRISELITPDIQSLRELFFEDEGVLPENRVWTDFGGILMECGLKSALDQDMVIKRVKCFAQRSQNVEGTSLRAQKLLKSATFWSSDLISGDTAIIRESRWLPAIDPQRGHVFKNAQECRGLDAASLVGLVFPVLDFVISADWSRRLGWQSDIPHGILLSQLKKGIEREDRKVVDAVLKYIQQKGLFEVLQRDLKTLKCIVASNLRLVPVQQAFQTRCDKLDPYLFNIEVRFWSKHHRLLQNLEVAEQPTLQDLLKVQNQLPSERELEENQVPTAVEILKLASKFPRDQLSSLKVLDGKRILRAIEDITYNDIGPSIPPGTYHFTHPDIPESVIIKLRIEPLSSLCERLKLGITDEDEFDQHEDVASAISDALARYPVESTFKEFLANAEDCKNASQLNWLLDERNHSKDRTLTHELKNCQGPALLVHNDGVFTEKDFEGLKSVGRGSKRDDASAIGKFGRGSQTMYHWTDVPMILSGKWLVILEKPGLKRLLSVWREHFRDQLTPFDGLWDFSSELDYYPGTIFRFPLRASGSQSKLMDFGSSMDFDAARKCLDKFLEEDGRISLLFLRRIRYMDFKVYGVKEPCWSITQSPRGDTFSGWTDCITTKHMNGELDGTFVDRWRVAVEDLENVRADLQFGHKKTMKDTSCGLAALVHDPTRRQKSIFSNDPVPKYFSSLPLSFRTDLPVHVHATFLLASDRASIPIEDSAQEDGGKWNKWLLSEVLPRSYLSFLGDIGRELLSSSSPYQFWPQKSPPDRHLSEYLYTEFWRMLPDKQYRVFPLERQVRLARNGKRIPPELVTMNEAVFDFLTNDQSFALRGVLESQIQNLVRPPVKVRSKLQKMRVETVRPESLLTLFQKDGASKCLEDASSKDSNVLERLFEIINPALDENLTELNGCRILPLVDGTLGILELTTASNRANYYFLANAQELELFDFATSILAGQDGPGKFFKEIVSKSSKFNVARLNLSDMETILKRRNFGNSSPSEDASAWLTKFWEYCKATAAQSFQDQPLTPYLETCDYPIFEATCNGIKSYISPAKWDSLPSVIEPNNLYQLSLCAKFPGIYIFNAHFVPAYLQNMESSLNRSNSFLRFIGAISKLAGLASMNLTAYVNKNLDLNEKKLLQKLLINYVSREIRAKPLPIMHLLKLLPVWPNVDSSKWISAVGVLGTRYAGVLLPWMNRYNMFMDHETFTANISVLAALGVSETSVHTILSTYILPYLPQKIENIDSYLSFLLEIVHQPDWKKSVRELGQSRLALDRAKNLRYPRDLYDHEDAIFTAAFRDSQKDSFLLERLQSMRYFWIALGLKHTVNGLFEPKDYIVCLKQMRGRLETRKAAGLPSDVFNDAQMVLQPLIAPSTALSRLSVSDWSIVLGEATFPVQSKFEDQPFHRRERMESCAAEMPLLRLPEIFAAEHLPICWSQTSFPAFQPTVTTLAHINNGKPPTAMVWRHILYLTSTVESLAECSVDWFLFDLYNAYEYLQINLKESRASFWDYRGERIWFNLEQTDRSLVRKADLISSRCGIENLILESSCDTKNLRSVGQVLFRYSKLLRILNCKSIVYPFVQPPNLAKSQLISTSLERLRQSQTLLDVTLEAEGGSIRAHKLVLAASSEYFQKRYKGEWSDNDSIDLRIFSHSTLSIVVDFAYADAFDWKSMHLEENYTITASADKLDELLDLLTAAEYLGMPNLKGQAEAQVLAQARVFIREANVIGVLERARDAKAHDVEAYCKKFYGKNKEAVDLAIMG